MNKSTLPFKKLAFASNIFKANPRRTFYLVLIGTSILTALSCQMTSGTKKDSNQFFGLLGSDTEEAPSGPFIRFVQSSTTNDEDIIALDASVCESDDDDKPPFKWRLIVNTPFGTHTANIVYPQTTLERVAKVAIENRHLSMDLTDYPTAADIKAACEAFDESPEAAKVVVDDRFVDLIRPWAEEIAPDCKFPENKLASWSCQMNGANPSSSLRELVRIKSKMIRSWSRQPYILARRVAVSQQLAKALITKKPEKLDTFCNIIRQSSPIELPVVMTSKKWQTTTCNGDYVKRTLAGQIGLEKSLDEINTFKTIFEKTARLGYFTIRIPSSKAPTKTILVNLTPHSDVKENLLKAIKKSWASDYNTQLPEFCWHPIFGETGELLYKARYLGLGTQAGNANCQIDKDKKGMFETTAQTYLADSIASETEFVVSNFRAKLLRLPEGNYNFTLQGLPDDPSQWDDAAEFGPQSGGNIAWTRRRPNPIIRKW